MATQVDHDGEESPEDAGWGHEMSRAATSVLVVDGEVDLCKNLADILSDLDYRVDAATNGMDALELVRKTPYDLALVDLTMPGMNGLVLYREIRALRAETSVLFLTTNPASAVAEEIQAIGAGPILCKPVHIPELLRRMTECLGNGISPKGAIVWH